MQFYNKDEKIRSLERKVRELEVDKEVYTEFFNDLKRAKGGLEKEVERLREENFRLTKLNNILTNSVCGAYKEGTAILYSEHYPRIITVVKDGKVEDMEKATGVSFNWYKNEFPSLEITTT